MSIFTKQELHILRCSLEYMFLGMSKDDERCRGIFGKIKALTDNYDEQFILTDEQLKQAQEDDYIAPPEL